MAKHDQYADAELAVLLNRDDRLAFAEIYERFKGPLYLHAFRKSGSEEEADDIVHDLFAALWENRETLELTGLLSGYLYTATRNRVFKMINQFRIFRADRAVVRPGGDVYGKMVF